jgi:hypothetical protein
MIVEGLSMPAALQGKAEADPGAKWLAGDRVASRESKATCDQNNSYSDPDPTGLLRQKRAPRLSQ